MKTILCLQVIQTQVAGQNQLVGQFVDPILGEADKP